MLQPVPCPCVVSLVLQFCPRLAVFFFSNPGRPSQVCPHHLAVLDVVLGLPYDVPGLSAAPPGCTNPQVPTPWPPCLSRCLSTRSEGTQNYSAVGTFQRATELKVGEWRLVTFTYKGNTEPWQCNATMQSVLCCTVLCDLPASPQCITIREVATLVNLSACIDHSIEYNS